jgi:hypothetical protein
MHLQQSPAIQRQQGLPPPGEQRRDRPPDEGLLAAVGLALHESLTAIVEEQPGAHELLTDYAEAESFEPAYRRAQQAWQQRIRPALSRPWASFRHAPALTTAEMATITEPVRGRMRRWFARSGLLEPE